MKKGIVGYGGFAREVFFSLPEKERDELVFFVEDSYFYTNESNLLPLSKFNPHEYELIVAIGDIETRKRIVNSLPSETTYFTHIHPSAQILDSKVKIGIGSIICAGAILTTNISIGKHSQLNLMTTIGHDCRIGDFFTTAPGVKISGNCTISNDVYFGTNASVKQSIEICNNVVIGMNSAVVKNIIDEGTYVGTPSKKIK